MYLEEQYLSTFISNIKHHAKKDGVVMLNLTHWVRGERLLKLDKVSHNATFYCDLSQANEDLYKNLDRLKKRCIKKAKESNLDTRFFYKEEAIPYIPEFLKLRELTQQRAIHNNKNASMLLKSQAFFEDLFKNYETTMVTVRVDGIMVAAATFIQGGNTVFAHMSGSLAEYNKSTGAGTYYYWAAMQYFKEKNVRFFDFGGSPYYPTEEDPAYGVYIFKKGFGADYYTGIEGKIIISKLKFKLLNFALSQRKLLRFISNKI
jgi:lipid II:glycine glycyltransferase (peptidoglycan interpeptide bridge formation enzyme)